MRALLLLLAVSCATEPVLFEPTDTPSAPPAPGVPGYQLFEAGPVRPVALTPSGDRLLVTNIPDDRLEVFDVAPDGSLTHAGSIAVGMRPVAVQARTDNEAWVVNHLSDSVSIVNLNQGVVTRTLLVGDAPRDLVFARGRAFVTSARRGQHLTHPSLAGVPGAGNPELTTPGVGRASVWVFTATNPGRGVGGRPVEIVHLFGDTPRALATDGTKVFAGVLFSGNQTTTIAEPLVCNGFAAAGSCIGDGISMPGGMVNGRFPGGNPGPSDNHAGRRAPEVGLIVQYEDASATWTDELGRNWNNAVRFSLPDLDVFELDAATLSVDHSYAHVGTTLFNAAVHPSGRVWVSQTDAQNTTRFEGSGLHGGSTVQGDLARAGITVLDPLTGSVTPTDLNAHLDRSITPAPAGAEDHSLSTPLQVVFSPDGATAYVAAYGSSRIGVLPVADVEAGTLDPTVASAAYLDVSGGGPGGLAVSADGSRLYVYTRFDDGVSVLDTTAGTELSHLQLHSPEPTDVALGRSVLYDARETSSNGEASCASCHIFGDMDHLAWDLGDPDGDVQNNPLDIRLEAVASGGGINGTGRIRDLHPMKGPMLTQTLHGMSTSGAMHWRADRSSGFFGNDATDERLSFLNFIVAFRGLLGDDVPETDPTRQSRMNQFADFALALQHPPNPVRSLDNSLTPSQQAGLDFYDGPRRSDGLDSDFGGDQLGFTCEGCHRLDPAQGFFGTDGAASFEAETQIDKIPHLRNLYTRVGMYGLPDGSFLLAGDNSDKGDQIRGYGIGHDGGIDTIFRFLRAEVFRNNGGVGFPSDATRRDVEQLILAFDTDLAPVVGQQVTVRPDNAGQVADRVLLLLEQAGTPFTSLTLGGTVASCDVVARVRFAGRQAGLLYDPVTGSFEADVSGVRQVEPLELRDYVRQSGRAVTLTCVPPGSGWRLAMDRDGDGVRDGDEVANGTDPADAGSF